MKEIWKKILDNEKYEVSNLGNVRHVGSKNLKIQYSREGYGCVLIYDKNNKAQNIRIHREVLKSFNYFEGCEKLEVNHKNYNRSDNRLENLEWCTSSENNIHRNKHLKYYNSKKCKDSLGNEFESYREAGRYYNISPNTVKRDVLGITKKEDSKREIFFTGL